MANKTKVNLVISRKVDGSESVDSNGEVKYQYNQEITPDQAQASDSVFYDSEDELMAFNAYLSTKHLCIASLEMDDQPAVRHMNRDGEPSKNLRTWIATKGGLREYYIPVIEPTS